MVRMMPVPFRPIGPQGKNRRNASRAARIGSVRGRADLECSARQGMPLRPPVPPVGPCGVVKFKIGLSRAGSAQFSPTVGVLQEKRSFPRTANFEEPFESSTPA